MAKKLRIAFAGGGSGGHVYPIVAVAEALKEQAHAAGTELELHYYGANDRFRMDIERQGIKFHSLLTGKLRRYASILTIIHIPKIFLGFFQALFKIYFLMPDAVFSKGGPGAFPVVMAAWFYKIPIVIHESDSAPGLTTLASARFARKIALSFEETVPYFNPRKIVLSGNPVRQELLTNRLSQDEAKRKLGFDPAKPLLFVTGGSQGAAKLNEFVILNLDTFLPLMQVLHQTGPDQFLEIRKLAEAEVVGLPTTSASANLRISRNWSGPVWCRTCIRGRKVSRFRMTNSFSFAAPWEPPVTKRSGLAGSKPSLRLASSCDRRLVSNSCRTGFPDSTIFRGLKYGTVSSKLRAILRANLAEARVVNPGALSDSWITMGI